MTFFAFKTVIEMLLEAKKCLRTQLGFKDTLFINHFCNSKPKRFRNYYFLTFDDNPWPNLICKTYRRA